MRLLIIAACLSFIVGCSREDPADRVAFVIVDGTPLTVGQVRHAVLLEQSLQMRTRKMALSESRLTKWRNSTAFRLIPSELAKMLLIRYFNCENVQSTDASDAAILKRYNSRLRGKYLSLADLIASFTPDDQAAFKKRLEYESRLEAYRLSLVPVLKVSDEELADKIKQENEYNAKAMAINSNAWARANACYNELLNGADWMKAAVKYSEDALVSSNNLEFAEDWMHYPVSGSSVDPTISEALKKLEIGQFTKPLDTDYGVLIVRLESRDDTDMLCSRILFRVIDVQQGDINEEILRKQMEQDAFAQHMSALTKRLFDEATIEYPMGQEITYKIWPEKELKR